MEEGWPLPRWLSASAGREQVWRRCQDHTRRSRFSQRRSGASSQLVGLSGRRGAATRAQPGAWGSASCIPGLTASWDPTCHAKPALNESQVPGSNAAAGQDLTQTSGNHPGAFWTYQHGEETKKMSTYFPSACSRRDHRFRPSKRRTARVFPCFSCKGDNDRGSPQESPSAGGM